MGSTVTNVVFRPRSSLLSIIDVAEANGWREAQQFQRAERQLEEVIYELPDGETVVRGIDDHFVVVVFASITGPNSAEVEAQLRRRGKALDESTLWSWASAGSPQQRAFALRAFAATSEKDADSRIVELYMHAVKDGHPDVRQSLIDSVGRVAWRELWPVVDELSKDNSEEVKNLRRAYERHLPQS